MSDDQDWNDQSRADLRDLLREKIRGELRLAKTDPADILKIYRQAHIEDECPEDEWDEFDQFADDELDRAFSQLATEQAHWPAETDCDRLDHVEAALRDRGILLWQASPCCDSCTFDEIPDRIETIENRHLGFRNRCRGYTYFIDQNLPQMLAESTNVLLYLSYGGYPPDNYDASPEAYKEKALAIAHEVCQSLRDAGFRVDWNGDFSKKIGVSLNWQRRTMLR